MKNCIVVKRYKMNPQSFVDSLNHREMPKFGYEFINGHWWRPVYNKNEYHREDFKTKDYIDNQQKRLHEKFYESPDSSKKLRVKEPDGRTTPR